MQKLNYLFLQLSTSCFSKILWKLQIVHVQVKLCDLCFNWKLFLALGENITPPLIGLKVKLSGPNDPTVWATSFQRFLRRNSPVSHLHDSILYKRCKVMTRCVWTDTKKSWKSFSPIYIFIFFWRLKYQKVYSMSIGNLKNQSVGWFPE